MNKRILGKLVSALLLVVFVFTAFVPAAQASAQGNTIVDLVLATNAETGEFSILIAALQAADPAVIEKLGKKGPFTVFAPTDAAFQALLTELGVTAEQLLSDQALLTQVLLYHVAKGDIDSVEVLKKNRIRTLQGGSLTQEDAILTDERCRSANIVSVDIQASNGVIHVIDRVVLPSADPSADKKKVCNSIVDVALAANAETGEFSILIAALKAANPGLIQRLSDKGQYTVFAPTDAAFQALLAELGVTADQLLGNQRLLTNVLRYHIIAKELEASDVLSRNHLRTIQNGILRQNNGVLTDERGRTATIVSVDIEAGNGIIHVIDRVVLPKGNQQADDDDDDDD
jgi:uncharacterized surface protein with fasciclin (FAS1) repeats